MRNLTTNQLTLAVLLALAGCTAPATQMPLHLAASNAAALTKPVPTAAITGPRNAAGQFTVTLSNGAVLTGGFSARPKPGPTTPRGGPVLASNVQTIDEISMVATNQAAAMRCNGLRTNAALTVTCVLSDGSAYQGTQSYEDK